MKKRKKSVYKVNNQRSFGITRILGCLLILLVCIKLVMSLNKEDFYKHYPQAEKGAINLVLDSEVIGEAGIIQNNDEIYIPVNTIKETVDPYIYINDDMESITITTADHVIKMHSDETTYYVNDQPTELSLPLYTIDDTSYLPVNIMEDIYNTAVNYNADTKILSIDSNKDKVTSANIKKNCNLYYTTDKKSRVADRIKKDSLVTVFDTEGNYTHIRTQEGYVGYVKTNNIGDIVNTPSITEEKVLWQPSEGKINMVFDQVRSINAVSDTSRRTPVDGLDVISPTFFSFENTQGDIKNIADKSYVDWAHNNGYQVWALITDNFDGTVSRAVLTNDDTRAHVVKQLLAYCSMYDLDGINIDFESVPTDCSQQWIQFVRELTPMLHKEGVVVSVDCFVPKPWTAHYMRKELSETVDYLVVMGYDEHYSGSEESGSVASISWSEEALSATLNQGVPKEKLILGMPFYTRIWTETADGQVSAESCGMEKAYDTMKQKGADIQWLDDMGQYYGEVTEGNVTYKCWFEDERSIKLRVEKAKEYDAAGVAGWKKGLEDPKIWSVIKDEIKS